MACGCWADGGPPDRAEGARYAGPALGTALLRRGRGALMLTRLRKYTEDLRTFPGDATLAYRTTGSRAYGRYSPHRWVYRVVRTGHFIVYASRSTARRGDTTSRGYHHLLGCRPMARVDEVGDSTRARSLPAIARRRPPLSGSLARLRADRLWPGWRSELGPTSRSARSSCRPTRHISGNLYVLPRERRNGIGSALASARIRTARERGFREGWRMIAPPTLHPWVP